MNLSSAKKWLRIVVRIAGYSGGGTARLRFNGDTGSNYSQSRSDDFGSPSAATAQSGIRVANTGITGPCFFTAMIRNVSSQGKTVILEGMSNSESSGTAPTINTVRGVWGSD